VLDREHHMGYAVAHALQALQSPGQDLAPPVAQRRTTHGTRPRGAARVDARRVGRIDGLFTPFGGQDLQVDGDGRTRRQKERVRIPTRNEPREHVSVGGQEGLTDGAKSVDEEGLRVLVVENFGKGERASPGGVFLVPTRHLPPGVSPIVAYGGTQGAAKGMVSFFVRRLVGTISTMLP
jgi:hypothetical protein